MLLLLMFCVEKNATDFLAWLHWTLCTCTHASLSLSLPPSFGLYIISIDSSELSSLRYTYSHTAAWIWVYLCILHNYYSSMGRVWVRTYIHFNDPIKESTIFITCTMCSNTQTHIYVHIRGVLLLLWLHSNWNNHNKKDTKVSINPFNVHLHRVSKKQTNRSRSIEFRLITVGVPI